MGVQCRLRSKDCDEVAVTQLRLAGRRLRRGEWPEPVVGELELTVMPETNARRPLKKLDLFGVPGTVR